MFGWFDGSMNQTDCTLTKENSPVVRDAQIGDEIELYIGDALNLRLELGNKHDTIAPLFKYKCPKDHSIKVLYSLVDLDSLNSKLNPEYLDLIAAKNYQKECDLCANDLGHQKRFLITQYFCKECNQTYCGACVLKMREICD